MSAWHLRRARQVIRGGGLVAYPTEAVFGLGCNPDDEAAVRRLLALKRRPAGKGLILIAASLEQLLPYMAALSDGDLAALQRTWPGPVTWIVPAATDIASILTGGRDGIAVRVTGHPVAAALCRCCGQALVSTSANLTGRKPARRAATVRRRLGGDIDYIVPGATGGRARPSDIIDLRSGRLLRS